MFLSEKPSLGGTNNIVNIVVEYLFSTRPFEDKLCYLTIKSTKNPVQKQYK